MTNTTITKSANSGNQYQYMIVSKWMGKWSTRMIFKSQQGFQSDKQVYLSMLQSHMASGKRATTSVKEAQLKILSAILGQNKAGAQVNEVANFLTELRHYRLFNSKSLDLMEQWILSHWGLLNQSNQLAVSCLMVEQARYGLFAKHRSFLHELIGKKPKNKQMDLFRALYDYCVSVTENSLAHGHFLSTNASQLQKMVSKNTPWAKEVGMMSKLQEALRIKSKGQAVIQVTHTQRARSNLQIQVQALLAAAGFSFHRQVSIFGFLVDFVVLKRQTDGKFLRGSDGCILEVMGSHHFTVESKLFGQDILRCLILQEFMPVATIDDAFINQKKGIQNKIQKLSKAVGNAYAKKDNSFYSGREKKV